MSWWPIVRLQTDWLALGLDERRFNRQLPAQGFEDDHRPTAYHFRHTVMDELTQYHVLEAVVADVSCQNRKGITYGHYGK
jgi:hypothetical protein